MLFFPPPQKVCLIFPMTFHFHLHFCYIIDLFLLPSVHKGLIRTYLQIFLIHPFLIHVNYCTNDSSLLFPLLLRLLRANADLVLYSCAVNRLVGLSVPST
jgi:hypothetical protein